MHRLVTIAKEQGELPLSATSAVAIFGSFDFIGGIAGMALLSCIGRKTILLAGHLLMTVFLVIAGIAFQYTQVLLMYISLCGFVFSYSAFCGSGIWIYIGETTMDTAIGIITLAFQLSMI